MGVERLFFISQVIVAGVKITLVVMADCASRVAGKSGAVKARVSNASECLIGVPFD